KFGGKNSRQYLGRSVSHYKKSRLKRIASWRALKIKDECRKLIDDHPEFALKSLPNFHKRTKLIILLTVLKSYSISKVIKEEDDIERIILMPSKYYKEYNTNEYGLISLNKAGYFLEMSKTAFDLLVSEHLDVFRRIGTYNKEWYLPYLYLEKIKEKSGFDIVKAKYEMLAKNIKPEY
ncbi:MAG TPA: hypothetical protein VE912_01825, partial [Bacteroidales bacterium]|nr:hypothetical protein [Bacteroidales bacterium]